MMSCLPFCATPPVKAMLQPTLISSAARAGRSSAIGDIASAAKLETKSRRVFCMAFLPLIFCSPSPCGGKGDETSMVHLVGRHDTPEIGGRGVFGPHFRPLRIVAMPRPRLEIAEL